MRYLGILLLLTAATALLAAPEPGPKPHGLKERVSLTTSRVVGHPEPPPPYRAKRAFPKLTFKNSLYIIGEPGSDRLLVVEQAGRIRVFKDDPNVEKTELFCELKDADTYGMTFHPHYAHNRYVYIFSNGPREGKNIRNRILRFTVARDGPQVCDPKSETLIIEWPSNGHNGGDLAFGPDGCLYLTSGDGTSDSDGDDTGQKITDLASGILRIDVDHPAPGEQYSVPADNPFLHLKDAGPELWAYGFRNPWRMCFDPSTGEMLVGDIGQDLWELIRLVKRGSNHGWCVYEGSHPFQLNRQRGPTPITFPLMEHPHSEARSITGGLVYQGQQFKDLQGAYIYGDYSTGKIWALRHQDGKVTAHREIADTPYEILGFGQDQHGEMFFVDYGGGIYELEPSPRETMTGAFPTKLSDTGLFLSVKEHRPAPGLIPYSVNAALWSDGAHKERFIAIPGTGQIEFVGDGVWRFPEGAVLVKTFSLGDDEQARRRIETRLLVFQQKEWVGYSYIWNEAQTDATLVCPGGQKQTYTVATPSGHRQQTWHFPSRAECMVCHSRAAGFVLGPTTLQMNRDHDYGGVIDNQLQALEHVGAFKVDQRDHVRHAEATRQKTLTPLRTTLELTRSLAPTGADPATAIGDALQKTSEQMKERELAELERQPRTTTRLAKPPADYPRLVDPHDPQADLTLRVRSYLHANCAICHVEAGGGNSAINLHFDTKPAAMKLLDVPPQHDRFGIQDARLVAPGHPERSMLLHRIATHGPGRMPPLASSVVDEQATKLVADWIRQMK